MRRKRLMVLITSLLFFYTSGAQSSAQTLDVVAWNIQWFGHTVQYPPDDNLQEENVKKIMRYLDADLYALSEVVDTMRLRRVTDSLGSNFSYVVSPFCSGNTTGIGTTWLSCQKLAFVYNRNIFTNVQTRGLMRSSGAAYYNFASGRFPFMLTADVKINNVSRRINFILIHAKAGSTVSDYERRYDGARELKDTLDQYYSNTANIILGDFNDALDRTICSSCPSQLSSYDPIIKDSVDGDHYVSITLPLARAGLSSMTNFPNLVDNHVISNEMQMAYIPQSASVRTDVVPLVVQYGATTSDHYPIFSQYDLNQVITSIRQPEDLRSFLNINIDADGSFARIISTKQMNDVHISFIDMNGRVLTRNFIKRLLPSATNTIPLPGISKGIYLIQIKSKEGNSSFKFFK
jgi:hypothetical protein